MKCKYNIKYDWILSLRLNIKNPRVIVLTNQNAN